jgi:hypothetical protein
MTVHMFRGFISRGKMSVDDLETRINDWVDSNAEWTDDAVDYTLSESNTELDDSGVTYYTIDVRFLQDDTKDNIVQKFTDKLDNKVDWYRLGYHLCDHDESSGSPCSWDDSVSWTAKDVTISSGVPTFQ